MRLCIFAAHDHKPTLDAFDTERVAGTDDVTEDNKHNRKSADIRAKKRGRSKGAAEPDRRDLRESEIA